MSYTSVVSELDHTIQRARENLFTGILSVGTNPAEAEWFLYFLVGQIVWANTRIHSRRRWQRQFLKYSSDLNPKVLDEIVYHPHNNYPVMAKLVMQQRFRREQFSQIVVGCISEILFDIIHQATLRARHLQKTPLIYKASVCNGANFPCIGLHREPVWKQVQQDWHAWIDANLVSYCPNLAPKIVRADVLQEYTSKENFQTLKKIATGKETLRDLAIKTKQPLVALTRSLVPHIRRDLIELTTVQDLSVRGHSRRRKHKKAVDHKNKPTATATTKASASTQSDRIIRSLGTVKDEAVVAYIENNPTDSQAMADIFAGSQYRYVNIADSLQVLPQLLDLQPQLIFLDLVMPLVNGYELCAQIRRVAMFENVPIVVMTNHTGVPARLRAKVVGATAFLSKPVNPKQVLEITLKHLQPEFTDFSNQIHSYDHLLQSV